MWALPTRSWLAWKSWADILDEVGKGDGEQDDGVILNQMNDLRDLINQAITNGITDYEGAIKSSATSLVTLLNQYADDLQTLQGTFETYLNQDVDRVTGSSTICET